MLTLTDRAVSALKSVLTEDLPLLRVMAAAGGCAGLQYRMGLEEGPSPDDLVVECSGIPVLIDPPSQMWLTGVTVDFIETEQGTGFVFNNPNAKCSCAGGCG